MTWILLIPIYLLIGLMLIGSTERARLARGQPRYPREVFLGGVCLWPVAIIAGVVIAVITLYRQDLS